MTQLKTTNAQPRITVYGDKDSGKTSFSRVVQGENPRIGGDLSNKLGTSSVELFAGIVDLGDFRAAYTVTDTPGEDTWWKDPKTLFMRKVAFKSSDALIGIADITNPTSITSLTGNWENVIAQYGDEKTRNKATRYFLLNKVDKAPEIKDILIRELDNTEDPEEKMRLILRRYGGMVKNGEYIAGQLYKGLENRGLEELYGGTYLVSNGLSTTEFGGEYSQWMENYKNSIQGFMSLLTRNILKSQGKDVGEFVISYEDHMNDMAAAPA